ncbi:MAG: 4-(cytidine 5'-diphospho)-2-C-methyl-D-erythritol kinase, partial [Rhodospirillaceae bacterium]
AKINLHLHVLGKRSDGYHLLDSLAVFCGVHDTITAEPAQDLLLSVTGPGSETLREEGDNLVLRAARALRDCVLEGGYWPDADKGAPPPALGAHLTLIKRLPVASGIGGGSSDAAATLRALMALWDCTPPPSALDPLATGLGADVPVCLKGRAALMAGIGEQLDPAPVLPECYMVLVNPGVAVSTPAVFRARTGPYSEPSDWIRHKGMLDSAEDLAKACTLYGNDLEPPAKTVAPVINDVLAALESQKGVLLARMSGSGATCFGLCATSTEAQDAVDRIRVNHPGWWAASGKMVTNFNDIPPDLFS